MLSETAKSVLDGATLDSLVSLIANVEVDEDDRANARMAGRDMTAYYDERKSPFLAEAARLCSSGFTVTERLDGTPDFVLEAPASAWRAALHGRDSAFAGPGIIFLANLPEWSTDAGVEGD